MNKFLSKLINSHAIGQLFNLGGKTTAWKKVRELKAGMKIAVRESMQIEFDEIVSIKKLPAERVWDIEVEGTHNFVAGHYVNRKTGQALTAEQEELYLAWKKSLGDSGSEFPCVTEQASFISEGSGGASSDPSRGTDQTPASTFSGDGLSTDIVSPKASSATLTPDYQSSPASANLSSIKKALVAEGSFASVEGSVEPLSNRIESNITHNKEMSSKLGSRRRDLHPHLLFDKKGILLGELRRHATTPSRIILSRLKKTGVKEEDLPFIQFGGIIAHNTSGILLRAGAASLQLSSSATSTTADIELAAADQIDLFAGRFSLTTSSGTAGDVKIDSAGTLTLSTSRNNTNVALLSGSGAFNVTAGTTTQTYSGNNQNAILLQASNGGIQLSTGSVGNGSLRLLSSGSLTIETSQNNTNISILPGSGGVALGVSTPAGSATLDISSTTKGFLPPRMTTTQRDNISSPTKGLVIFNDTTAQLNVYSGSSWQPVGTGGGSCNSSNDCLVVLTPEYPNAIISADGSNNIGTVTSDLTISASNYYYNYYEFSSGQASLQDYDVYVSWQLPSGWADWDDAANAISIDLATEDASSANTKVDATIYRQSDADSYSETANVSPTGGEWRTTLESKSVLDITKTNLNTIATWAAGDIMVIKLKLYSKDNYYSRVGNIRIIYENQ